MQGGTGTSYAHSGETTEWEDILIKKGITSKEDVLLSKGLNPEDFAERPPEEFVEALPEERLIFASLNQLKEMEDEEEFSDSRALEEYRQLRLQEMQAERARNIFGDVVEISKDEWVREVTEKSNHFWVVVHLYNDSVIESRLLEETMQRLSAKFKYIKCLKIRAQQAIENWPERNVPTLFVYYEGELKHQMITLQPVGGKTMKDSDMEWWFAQRKIVTTSELTEDPRCTDCGGDNRKQVTNLSSQCNMRLNHAIDSDEDDYDLDNC